MIKIVDLNPEVIALAKEAGYESECADYFQVAYQTPFSVLMTASNPRFTFGGGLDYAFTQHFPKLTDYKRMKGGEMERIGNIVFAITVDSSYKGSKAIIKKAIDFAVSQTLQGETLLLSAVGTGIGGMNPKDFISCLPTP